MPGAGTEFGRVVVHRHASHPYLSDRKSVMQEHAPLHVRIWEPAQGSFCGSYMPKAAPKKLNELVHCFAANLSKTRAALLARPLVFRLYDLLPPVLWPAPSSPSLQSQQPLKHLQPGSKDQDAR